MWLWFFRFASRTICDSNWATSCNYYWTNITDTKSNCKIGFHLIGVEVRTSDASYYKWTQWIFIELFHSWYNKTSDKAESIENFSRTFFKIRKKEKLKCSSEWWIKFLCKMECCWWKRKQDILLNYRLAYRAETTVNWCPALERFCIVGVKDGKSGTWRLSCFSEKWCNGHENHCVFWKDFSIVENF